MARRGVGHAVRPVPAGDPAAWFARGWAGSGQAFLWWRPSADFALVGAGAAVRCPAADLRGVRRWWRHVASAVDPAGSRPGTGPLLWSGMAFDPGDDRPVRDPYWRAFPALEALVPERMLTRLAGRAWLTVNAAEGREPRADAAEEPMLAGDPQAPVRPAVLSVVDDPPQAAWSRSVRELEADLRRGRIEKVVLARCKRVRTAAPVDVATVLRRLASDHPESTVFAAGAGDACFLGASPERLVRVQGQLVEAVSLAGSRPRGAGPDEDARLAAELRASGKDRREHALVVEAVAGVLRRTCADVRVAPEPTVVRLANVQHLLTAISARPRSPQPLLDLVARLHPTPAVGGVPRAEAIAAIRSLEGRPRGWYAAPVGWVGPDGDGEFAVAIRSGVVRGRDALLYAGCGIVAGSDPEAERVESEAKFGALLRALGASRP